MTILIKNGLVIKTEKNTVIIMNQSKKDNFIKNKNINSNKFIVPIP